MNRTIKEATVKRYHYETHDELRQHLTDFVAACNAAAAAIDHTLPRGPLFPAGRDGALMKLERLMDDVLPGYAAIRNDATRPAGASMLSPYLHFGVIGPREIMATVEAADAPANAREKFADELLTWREWFHYQARLLPAPEHYDRIPGWARETLEAHAADPRPEGETLAALLHGETRDESWNACQRQFLIDGWMHNNRRMYWGKRIIAMTPDPQTAWATTCYLNDRLSLDGRDPSTYAISPHRSAAAPPAATISPSMAGCRPAPTDRPATDPTAPNGCATPPTAPGPIRRCRTGCRPNRICRANHPSDASCR